MLHYRRKYFDQACRLLRDIERSSDDFSSLLSLQQLLAREIFRAEAHVERLKREKEDTTRTLKTSRASREQSQKWKRRVSWIEKRVDGYQQALFIWRSFGDGIAFSYLDRHAIKHAYYETASARPKRTAGSLSGKAGLRNEIAFLEHALSERVPAVLVDLTNSLRHGDVCLLGENDPYLIEIKSGSQLNRRGMRQASDIEKLHSFYQQDLADNLRGYSQLRRMAPSSPVQIYTEQLNQTLEEAKRGGIAVHSPEEGIYYIAARHLHSGTPAEALSNLNLGSACVFSLNEAKNHKAWPPYYPFTLSIRDPQDLYDFIRGHLYIMVIWDVAVTITRLEKENIRAEFRPGADYVLSMVDAVHGTEGAISEHLLTRIGLEFMSAQWIVEFAKEVLWPKPEGKFDTTIETP